MDDKFDSLIEVEDMGILVGTEATHPRCVIGNDVEQSWQVRRYIPQTIDRPLFALRSEL